MSPANPIPAEVSYALQQALNALQLGSIYALIALGYNMVYGVLQMINFAHGDLFMVGAFLYFLAAAYARLSFVAALVVSMAGVSLLGVLVERIAYRPLRNAPKMSAVITALGVGIFLENLTLALSPYPRHVPKLLDNASWSAAGVTMSSLQILIIAVSGALMLALRLIVHRTRYGTAMRAISWDINSAAVLGLPVNRVIAVTFAMGSALGGAAGALYAAAYPVIDPFMGVMVGWKAFISAVIGGIGSIGGAMAGGFILAALEVSVAAFGPSSYRDFVAFALLLLLLVFRPCGLFGKPRTGKV